jgi:hypothetical protein
VHDPLCIVPEAVIAIRRTPLKKLVLLLLFAFIPALAHAEEPLPVRPHWSFEIKVGNFVPDLPNFAQYYGKRDMPEYFIGVAYKITRQIEFGLEGGYLSSSGTALAPLHGTFGGSVTYKLYPANAFLLFRGIFNEQQWLVPYVGGGYTKMFYREEVDNQGTIKGSANGYHARGGLQFLLDNLDSKSAYNLYTGFGIFHTYLFVEAQYVHAVVESTNLGGTGYLVGLLFEF